MSSETNILRGSKSLFGAREIAKIGMLSAVAVILMLFEIPLWFAPGFYKIDLSEVPVLIGAFAMGPLAGVFIEIIKILLNFIINGTITAGIGEIANLLIGCAIVIPSAVIYKRTPTRKGALIGMAAGTIIMTITGCFLNAYVLLPTYAKAFNMPIDALVAMGKAVNPSITDLSTFIFLAVAPFNMLKGIVVSVVTLLLYKKISPVFRRKNS